MRRIGDILIITNEAALATTIADVLCDAGYTARIAGGRESMLAALARDPLALVLLDTFMPDSIGTTLREALRLQGLLQLPIVLLSTSPCTEADLRATDAIQWMAMPFDLDDLLACVARYVRPACLHASSPRSPLAEI